MMAAPKRVYVDLDDVICETGPDLLALLEKHFGRRVELEVWSGWVCTSGQILHHNSLPQKGKCKTLCMSVKTIA